MKEDPLLAVELKKSLKKNLSNFLKSFGLEKYDGNYLWFSEFNEYGCKKVFQYHKLKGESGTFRWGFCFNFIPTLTNSITIKNHRTDKSTLLHLWDEPLNYITYYGKPFSDHRSKGMVSHWGNEQFEETFRNLLLDCRSSISKWFSSDKSELELIKIIEFQTKFGKRYKTRNPKQAYICAFILAKIGKKEEGISLLKEIKKPLIEHNKRWLEPYNIIEDRLLKL